MTSGNNEARTKLLAQFSQANNFAEYTSYWDVLWKQGFRPWDNGNPNPALIDVLEEKKDLLSSSYQTRKLKALVPGCGKGYDVLLLAAYGYDTTGLEISETALREAKEFEEKSRDIEIYRTKNKEIQRGKIKWLAGDFFNEDFAESDGDDGKFDLIYDYTFLCALPPDMRPAWAKRMTELLAKEGRLVCVEFPTYKPHSTAGPPWALPSKVYEAHLARPGRELRYDKKEGLIEESLGEPDKGCLHRIAHFQPQRTQAVGYDSDGKVTDWIGIWSHSI